VPVVERAGEPLRRGDIEFLGPPVWEKFGRAVPPNETSIVMRAAGVLFPGDIEERGGVCSRCRTFSPRITGREVAIEILLK